MNVSRREILKLSGLASAGLVGASTSAVADDADPRPKPVAGEKPNANVPTTSVGALPGQADPVSAGDWIHHSNGWVTETSMADECNVYELLEETTQVFTIDGEEFVLDGLDDWDLTDPNPDPEYYCSAEFSYTTPPKPPGTTYELKWDVFGDAEEFPVISAFPFGNEIEIVRERGKGNGNGQ